MPDCAAVPLCLLGFLALSSACYIQNCPRGGKRSFPDSAIRQCLTCGPGRRGRCFGPIICCVVDRGCFMGSMETAGCARESFLFSPCDNPGKVCGSHGGRCAAPGVCCSADSCLADTSCLADAVAT